MGSERSRQRAISRWLDGEMTPAEKAAFEQRMTIDPELAAFAGKLQKIRRLYRELPLIPAPEGFRDRMRQVRAEQEAGAADAAAHSFRGWRLVATVAGATFVIGLLFQTVGVQQSPLPLAEYDLPAPAELTAVSSDSLPAALDSTRELPEFEFTPVSGN